MRLLWILLFCLASPLAMAESLSVRLDGRLMKKWKRSQLTGQLGSETVTVFEPHEGRNVTYQGFPLSRLLDTSLGKKWMVRDVVLFTCADGYQATVPVDRIRKEKAFLVYKRSGAKFTVNNRFQNEKNIRLGPYYLVWDNLEWPKERRELAEGWPYQVVSVEPVTFLKRFPQLAPPDKSSLEGFIAFQKYCLSCHQINGQGGKKGPELNYPVSVTEYFKKGWLKKWILDPQGIRAGTTMPALAKVPQREKIADSIVHYLQEMQKMKRKPRK